MNINKNSVTYVVNHAAFFVSHRLPLALGARDHGYKVSLVTGQPGSLSMEATAKKILSELKINHHKLFFQSAGINPIIEFVGFIQLVFFLIKTKPNVLHCASPKAVLYGGLAARLAGIKSVVLAISGMGFAFTQSNKRNSLRKIIASIYKKIFLFVLRHNNIHVIVQNKDDYQAMLNTRCIKSSKLHLIGGSGIELERFINFPIEKKEFIVVLPARMVADKGIFEFVAAVRRIKKNLPNWKFVLAGAADYKNPSTVTLDLIQSWQSEGLVEWMGHVDDIAILLGKASIVCLPSYREGMPKALLEASAAGCAIITTDVIGCRDAVINNETGDLVKVRDVDSLANALLTLINDRKKRERYGQSGRKLAIKNYGIQKVIDRTLNIYQELILNAS
jgi:glycosyltransferase involved in cell wall biosynthesis